MSSVRSIESGMFLIPQDLRYGDLSPRVRGGADQILARIQAQMAAKGASSLEEYNQAMADGRVSPEEADALAALYTRLQTVVDTGSCTPDWVQVTEVSSFRAPGDLAMMHAMKDGRLLVRVQNEGVGLELNGYHVLDPQTGAIFRRSKHSVMNSTWTEAYEDVWVSQDDTLLFVRKKDGGLRDVWTWKPDTDEPKRVGKVALGVGDRVYARSATDCFYISHWNTHDIEMVDIPTGTVTTTINLKGWVLWGRQMRGVVATGGFVFTVGGKDAFVNASGNNVMHPPVPLAHIDSYANGDIVCQKREGERLDEFSDMWIYKAKYNVWQPLVAAPEASLAAAQVCLLPSDPDVLVFSFTDTKTAWLGAVNRTSGVILWNQSVKLIMDGTGLFPRLSVALDGTVYLSDNDTVHVFGERGAA